jgi:hypothetical protein
MKQYESLKSQHIQKADEINKRYNLISAIRLATALAVIAVLYYFVQSQNNYLIVGLIGLIVIFLYLIKVHQRLAWNKKIEKELIAINSDELSYLRNEKNPFSNGAIHNDTGHAYAHDLDIFGENSLFQNLNRTGTYIGESKLASSLLSILSTKEIEDNQAAIKELAPKIEWRQGLIAIAKINKDNQESFEEILSWSKQRSNKLSGVVRILSFLSPITVLSLFTLYNLLDIAILFNLGLLLFVINLLILASQLKKVSQESIASGKVDRMVRQYSLIIEKIEKEGFECNKLNSLKNKLGTTKKASSSIANLSSHFAKMDNIMNAFSWIFNGVFLYHLHVLKALQQWKEDHGDDIPEWMDVIGEFEALNSLANFSYNNEGYIFPSISEKKELNFENLGHPLLRSEIRVDNSVSFNDQTFFILTGSNMSGKSTFLRTLGINMVLGSIGAPICATKASIYPLPVLVSMRLSDSLNDSESYFFAEVKRLKEIMDALDDHKSFVLLDEILRGTNSDDKRTGTIEVIKKMISKGAIGAIATHDLEVCLTTEEYPEILANKCFEVEIINNDLHFDYKLRDGVCQNKSATFLMRKMKIIG